MAASGHLEAMTTQTISGLEALLSELGVETPIPQLPGADVLNKPLDIGKSYLAHILTSIVECDLATACNSIQLPNNIYSGDFSVILPKLSHGRDFSALAIDLIQKVRLSTLIPTRQTRLTNCVVPAMSNLQPTISRRCPPKSHVLTTNATSTFVSVYQ